jgi:hypothetical protein
MWQVSDRFLTALRGSVRMVCVVDVLDGDTPVDGYTGLPVTAGNVSRDRTAAHLAQCSVTVAAPDLAPLSASSPLSPAGFEIQVSIGFDYDDGTSETVPVFTGPIQQSSVNATTLTTDLQAVDRSKRVADALLQSEVKVTAAAVSTTMLNLIRGDLGGSGVVFNHTLVYDTDGTTTPSGTLTASYEAGSDRWAICQDIAKAHGYESFFDGQGTWTLRDEPTTTTTTPVWTVDTGDGGVLLEAVEAWDREPAYNRVTVIGTNTEFDITYTGTAVDNDPASPSYYGTDDIPSRFGHKPMPTYHSAHVTSNASAVAAAKVLLKQKQGLPMSLDLTTVPNYALEAGDVVEVSSPLGDTTVVIDSIGIDLVPGGAMTCAVRARQESEPEEV